MDGRTDKWQLYFSTDDSMDGREVLDYYRSRFQLEFCFRDGKQHAGITKCRSTDFIKLDFHFNASLAAINLAKAACKRLGIAYSISSCKSFIHNAYMLERFICGHPKWFDGRIDFAKLDLTRCKEYEVNKGKLYGLRVYAKALKRYVSLAVWYPMDGRTDKWQLYFSTDDSMDGREVLDYYRTRFQREDRQVAALLLYRRFHGWT